MGIVTQKLTFCGIGAPVPHCKSFQIYRIYLFVVLMHFLDQCWHVNSTVALPSDVGWPVRKLREGVEEFYKWKQIQLCHHFVIPNRVIGSLGQVHIREAHLCGGFNINCISSFIPGLWVVHEESKSIVEYKWAMLVKGPEKWRAARSSIEPEQQRVFVWMFGLRGEIKIMHVGCTIFKGEIKISRIPIFIVYSRNFRNFSWAWPIRAIDC